MSATPNKLLSAAESSAIDEELFKSFSVVSLMELAGVSVAAAIADAYPKSSHPRPLLVCGPGNNGGDGLVAARHLWHFGYRPVVVYPKRTEKPLFVDLARQMGELGIPLLQEMPTEVDAQHDVIVDAVFGFSFKAGGLRAPFDTIVPTMKSSKLPLVSVDIPSGWDVDSGPTADGTGLEPDVLISLTGPKLCAAKFTGSRHYLGGRFVPPSILAKYGFTQPEFPGTEQVVRLS
jgi:NAD(P)H-hydrate epimerase